MPFDDQYSNSYMYARHNTKPSRLREREERLYGSKIPWSPGYQLQSRLYTSKDLSQLPPIKQPKPALDIILVTAPSSLRRQVTGICELFAEDFHYSHVSVPELLLKYAEAGDRKLLGELNTQGLKQNIEKWGVWVPHRYFTVPFMRRVLDDLVEKGERRFIIGGVEDEKCLKDFAEQVAAPSAVFSFVTMEEAAEAVLGAWPFMRVVAQEGRANECVYAELLAKMGEAAGLKDWNASYAVTMDTAAGARATRSMKVDEGQAGTLHDTPMAQVDSGEEDARR